MHKILVFLLSLFLLYSSFVWSEEWEELETEIELIDDPAVTEPAIDGVLLPWPMAETTDEAFAEVGFSLHLPSRLTKNTEQIIWNYVSTPPEILEAIILNDLGEIQTIVRRGRKSAMILNEDMWQKDTVSYDDGFYCVSCVDFAGYAISWSDAGFEWLIQEAEGEDPDTLYTMAKELEALNSAWVEEEGWTDCENLQDAKELTGITISPPEEIVSACLIRVIEGDDPAVEVICFADEESSEELLRIRRYANSDAFHNDLPYSKVWTLENGSLQLKGDEEGCYIGVKAEESGLLVILSASPKSPSDMYAFINAID